MSQDLSSQLHKSLDHLKSEYGKLQVGRANTTLVEDIEVDAYGNPTPLKGTASINVLDAKTLRIEPWDKSILANVEKSIRESDLGLNPQNMGDHLLIPIPPMTEERRKQLAQRVHSLGEEARVAIRNAREEARKEVKHQKEEGIISEDQQKDSENEIQEKVDKANAEVAEAMKNKEAEIMSV